MSNSSFQDSDVLDHRSKIVRVNGSMTGSFVLEILSFISSLRQQQQFFFLLVYLHEYVSNHLRYRRKSSCLGLFERLVPLVWDFFDTSI